MLVLTVFALSVVPQHAVAETADRPVQSPPMDEVLDLEEAALLLEITEESLRTAAERGELPGRRIGGEWRFRRVALLRWLGRPDGAPVDRDPLPAARLAETRGRGPDDEASVDDPVGEPAPGLVASDVFLRSRRVLLAPGQLVVEPQVFYTRSDSPDIQFISLTGTPPLAGTLGDATTVEQNITSVNLTGRYGLLEGVEGFAGLSFQDRRIKQEGEPEQKDTELRSVSLGVRATVLRETRHRPDIVIGVRGFAPTGDSSWGVGGRIVALKSADPIALFASLEYLHTFSRDFDEPRKLEPEDTFSAQVGYVFAVTDETSLSTSVQGLFVLDSNFDAGTIDSTEEFALRLGLTQRLRVDLFVEPSLVISLSGPGKFVTFGLRFPWIAYP